MEIRKLTTVDVPAAVRLSTQAGWNQTPEDWRRLLALAPEQCYAGWIDDRLVATATVVAYDNRVAWIGMVLVDEQHRKQGYGNRIFRHTLDGALDRGLHVGLDATDAGRAVYSQVGFATVARIERWGGVLNPRQTGETTTVRPATIEDVRELDRAACGIDRSDLLERLLAEPESAGFVAADGRPSGYALVRPGRERWQVGPVVAEDECVGRLLDAVGEYLGESPVIVDLLVDSTDTEAFEKLGLARQRLLKRMTWNEPEPLLMGEQVVAAAGFELG